jgi:hypothetical protein
MVKSAERRKQKYEAKVDADVARSRILALKDNMVANAEGYFANLAQMENEIKAAIMGLTVTVPSIMIPAYLNVGRELWKKQQKFTGVTFAAECFLVLNKWKGRGLLYTPLAAISLLFGYTYTY